MILFLGNVFSEQESYLVVDSAESEHKTTTNRLLFHFLLNDNDACLACSSTMDSSLRGHQARAKTKDHACNFCVLAHATDKTEESSTERQPGTGGGVERKLQSLETQLNLLTRRLSGTGSVSALSSGSDERSETGPASPSPSPSDTSKSTDSEQNTSLSTSKRKAGPLLSCNASSLPFAIDGTSRIPSIACSPILSEHYLKVLAPLLKIVPLTTVRLVFSSHEDDLPPSAVALRRSICFASAVTMHQEPRDLVSYSPWKPYAFACESSLTKGGLLTKPSIATLQALAIYLICGREVLDQDYVWSLTALLTRLAMKLKLHLDPDTQGLSHAESEYRRRLWWHICSLDASVAEADQTDPLIFERQCTTRMPMLISDAAMQGAAGQSLNMKQHCPDMFYSMIRFEITYYVRTIRFSEAFTEGNGWPSLSADGKLSVVESLEQTLKDKYWSSCDCKSVSCTLAILLSKALISALELKIMVQSRDICQSDTVLNACTTILEAGRTLRSDLALNMWYYLWQVDLEWHAAAIILIILRDHHIASTSAWPATDAFFENWKDSARASSQSNIWHCLQRLKNDAARQGEKKPGSLGRGQHNRRRSKTYSMVDTPAANDARKCSSGSETSSKGDQGSSLFDALESVFGGQVKIDALSVMF